MVREINRKFVGAQREQDQAQENVRQAQKAKDACVHALQEKAETLDSEIKKTKNCYDELVSLADKDVIPESEQGRLREPNPTIKDFNWILDITSRHKAFQLAMRYWEGRWILDAESIQNDTDKNREKRMNSGKASMETRFRRWCMLTPCLVSTLHSLPKHFRFKNGLKDGEGSDKKDDDGKQVFVSDYLLDFIDLLIIDEAGQVGPHIGAASFSLAQKAVVVGDIFQIEPISKIPVGTDYANAANDKLQFLWEEGRQASPLLVSGSADALLGSVMRLAQGATFAVSEGEQPESQHAGSY